MFTGIIEEKAKVLDVIEGDQSLQIAVAQPPFFDDLSVGDSVACNGVCLTVETFDGDKMTFTIGYETLQISGWTADQLRQTHLNLERSLRFGDRIHGHLVSGHVDGVTNLQEKEWAGDCLLLTFRLPPQRQKQIWEKSSVALNGVSLTVNWVENQAFQVCLVPETLRKTNLDQLQVGDVVNLETDYYMKGLLSSQGDKNA